MLWRGLASAGEVGSSNAECNEKRARPSFIEFIALDQDRLVAGHPRDVVPAVIGVVDALIDLAGAVGIDQIADRQVARRDALRVHETQRRHLDGIMGDVAPHIELGEALFQPRFGLVGRQQVAYPLRARLLGVVVVHGTHRRAQPALDRTVGGAHGVVEHDHLRRAGLALDQRLDLGVVFRADLLLVVEVAHLRVMACQDEGLAVERQVLGDRPGVVDAHLEVAVVADPARQAGAHRRIVGHRLDAEVGQVVHRRLDPGLDRGTRGGRFGKADRSHGRTR